MTTFADPYDIDFDAPPDPDPPPRRPRNIRPPIRSRLLTMTDLASLPDPEPLIEDTLDLGTVAVLAGYWGTMKSFVALDWAASVATGRRWMGRETAQRRVLYIAGEGAHGIYGRLTAWQTGWRMPIANDEFTLLPDPVHLLNGADVAELCDLVQSDGYGVVFVDTISKSIAGADENSAKDMSMVVANLYAIQRATLGGAVVALHHTGKDKVTVRGSSALEAGVDTVYATEGGPDSLILSRRKRKDGPLEDTLNLKFSAVSGTPSGVIEAAGSLGSSQTRRDLISHLTSHYSATGGSRSQIVETCGLPKTTAYREINELVTEGFLINQGTQTRPFYIVAKRSGG